MKTLIGKVVGGCQIVSEIAEGGMGVIYRAKQLSLEREVALKVLADRLAGDPNFVERFMREARAIARVNHPNILAVYDVGQDPDLSIHYMIMELVDGRSLSDVLKDKGTLSPEVATDYIKQASMGLACAQGAGIIHRDIKPENLMVTRQDVVKVSDFGLAKEAGGSTMTATDSVMGTPAYMSPEQCDGKKLDGRTDIYSLGGTFFRLITGRLPFEAETAMSMMYRHKHEPVIPPKQIVPAIPMTLSNVIVKMMAKRREDRYQTMDEVVKAIGQAVADDDGGDTHRTVSVTSPAVPGAPQTPGAPSAPVVPGAPQAPGAPRAPGAVPGLPIQLGATNPRRRELERLIAQGDARHRRGDLAGAARLWREAKTIQDDPRISERLEQHALPESEKSKATGESKVAEGELSEAARLYRAALELNPEDADAKERLRQIEERIASRREAINQVRQLLASNRFEDAVSSWEELPEDFRDPSLEKSISQVRDVVLPVNKLCDQGDVAMQAGELEKSHHLFARAADVDSQSDRARQGLRETERRLGRVERMLKEGYESNVKEDYQKAIDAWTDILKVAPNHAQARKLIIEARLRIGHGYRQKEGGLQNAISQWREVLKLEPEHRMALALLEQDEANHGQLSTLGGEAQSAFARGKYGTAISCWRQMLDLDPTQRRLEVMLAQARRLRRKRRLTLFGILIGVVVVGGAGGQFIREWLALGSAAELANTSPADAHTKLEALWLPVFLRGTIDEKKREYKLRYFLTAGGRAMSEGRFEEARGIYQRAKALSGKPNAAIDANLVRTEYEELMQKARAAEEAGEWNVAVPKFFEAEELARTHKMEKERLAADGRAEIARLIRAAVNAEEDGRSETARDYWRQAKRIMPDHPAVKKHFENLRESE